MIVVVCVVLFVDVSWVSSWLCVEVICGMYEFGSCEMFVVWVLMIVDVVCSVLVVFWSWVMLMVLLLFIIWVGCVMLVVDFSDGSVCDVSVLMVLVRLCMVWNGLLVSGI